MRPLPGIAFETVPPPLADTLPRMDVAAFVGVAASGPIDVPVAVEDVARFRDLFGDDPPLAWDPARGRVAHGLLGPAVEAFFENRGRRCWIVRAAGGGGAAPGEAPRPGDPYTHRFELPGIVAPFAALPAPTRARARSPGSWAATLAVSTALQRRALEPFTPAVAEAKGPLVARGGADAAPALTVAAPPGAAGPGDVVEVVLTAQSPPLHLYLEVARAIPVSGGLRLVAASGRFRLARPLPGPADRSPPLEVLSPGEVPSALAAIPAAAPVRASALSFELTVWQDHRALQRIADLSFSPRHPRFWGALPDDVELFATAARPRHDGRDDEAAALRAEASGDPSAGAAGQRFALAGPAPFAPPEDSPIHVPDAMDLVRRLDGAAPALEAVGGVPAPEDLAAQDGLAALEAVAFVDARVAGLSGEALVGTARALDDAWREWLTRPDRRPAPHRLRGVHAIVCVDEVSLVAAPDAALPRWEPAAPADLASLLGAPALDPVGGPDADGRLTLAWTPVADADAYRLEWDDSPEFPSPQVALDGEPDPAAGPLPDVAGRVAVFVVPAPSCARALWFRVRAARGGEPSAWSRTRPFRPSLFSPCDEDDLPEVTLVAAGDPPVLSWSADSGAPLAEDGNYRLEVAGDALFASARTAFLGRTPTSFRPGPATLAAWWRVRAERPAAAGPWSATVALSPAAGRPSLVPPPTEPADEAEYEAVLLDVQRSLLRLAAATGDRLALLALPRHHRVAEATAYLSALLPDETADAALPASEPRALRAGEEGALSFGALLHPWIARLVTRGAAREVDVAPPEGAVAGLLAETANDRGAWRAAANQPLAGVLALEPTLGDADARALAEVQIDPLVLSPRGFVLALDETLSRDADTRPVGVRRLLSLLRRLALREGTADVFEPLSSEFEERVRLRFGRLLSDLHFRGAFRGRTAAEAFAVVTDASVNPPQSLDLGRFVVELRVAPSQPLRFLRVRLLQTAPEQVTVAAP